MIVLALLVAGLILALIDEFIARGRSILGWAVILIAIALLIGQDFFQKLLS